MKKIVIELFPVEKSCPQGCPPCPLADRGTGPKGSVIDEEVNASFQLLESILAERGKKYAFYFLGPGDRRSLLPTMSHPDLVNEVALAIHKVRPETDPKALVEQFLQETRVFLADNFANRPAKLRISIVPEQLFVQEKEREILQLLIKGVEEMYGTKGKDGLGLLLEVRSNLVPQKDLIANLDAIRSGDQKYIEGLLSEYRGPVENGGSLHSEYYVGTHHESTMYHSVHEAQLDGHQSIAITNRVLAKFKGREPTVANYRREVMHELALQERTRELRQAAFAIAPRGVMFFHASIRINNPLFWMSHEDFRNTLQARRDDPRFDIEDFGRRTLVENIFVSHYKEWDLTFKDWLILFSEVRSSINPEMVQQYLDEH